MAYTEVLTGAPVQVSNQTYLALALSASLTLYWPREDSPDQTYLADLMDVTPSANGFVITLPDARLGSTGSVTIINNLSGSYSFTLNDNSGATIQAIAVGEVWILYLSSNSTAAGSWRSYQFGVQAGSVNVAALIGAGIKAIGTSLNQSMPVLTKSTNYTAVTADRAYVVLWTGGAGTLTLPSAATVGSDWFICVKNAGSGSLTISPPSGTIDSAASLVMPTSGSSSIFTDGTDYYTVGLGETSVGSFDYTTVNVAGTGNYTIAGAQLNRISYLLTGVLTGNRNFIVPTSTQQYWINNGTSGAYTLTVKTAAGTGVTVGQGLQAIVYCDGTNVVSAVVGTATPVPVAAGGTGSTTAAAARTALGSTATGDALYTSATAAAARTTLGSGAVGDAVFLTTTAAAGRSAIGLTGNYETGTFTATVTGEATAPTATMTYKIVGDVCTLYLSGATLLVASTTTAFTFSGLPAACRPSAIRNVPCVVEDNSVTNLPGECVLINSTSVTLAKITAGLVYNNAGFTAANNKGLADGWAATYPL